MGIGIIDIEFPIAFVGVHLHEVTQNHEWWEGVCKL